MPELTGQIIVSFRLSGTCEVINKEAYFSEERLGPGTMHALTGHPDRNTS